MKTELNLTDNALTVLERRYLKKDLDGNVVEKPEDMFRRVADNIAEADRNYGASDEEVKETADTFYEMMTNLEFLPNSPTLMNAGQEFQQLSACFVLPVEDSMESIFQAVKDTAMIHRSGGGTGFSFSRLRPKDDIVNSTGGKSSGPVSFIGAFNAATEVVKQGGKRRGANMAVLRVDHPDIEEFIEVKSDLSKLTNFNLSVAVTDEFMEAVENDWFYDFINPRNGEVVESVKARLIFDRMTELAWESGEPGVIFIDVMNKHNPTPHVGEYESCNPCGEQVLLPNESCNLGSINVSKCVIDCGDHYIVDWGKLSEIVLDAVHFLDNVIDMNDYPLPQIEEVTKSNRKIGLGVMGFADLLILLGISYGSTEAEEMAAKLMEHITYEARDVSNSLAEKRGAFPNWAHSVYDFPMRNATVTTIAPTGTISIIAGCSSGIEPLFAIAYSRNVMDGEELVEVNPLFEQVARDCGFYSEELMQQIADDGSIHEIEEIPEDVRNVFVTAHDVSPENHVRMQAAFQEYTDNAISKTVNLPREATVEDVRDIYKLAYELGCKGITVYRDGSREGQVLTTGKTEQEEPVEIAPRDRPMVVNGQTCAVRTGCGKLYVTLNEDDKGPFEVFCTMGKSGGCAASQSEALARMISLAFRCGIPSEEVARQLRGISCHSPAWNGNGERVLSCADAVGKVIDRLTGNEVVRSHSDGGGACPECGGSLSFEEGCATCHGCGYSKCG